MKPSVSNSGENLRRQFFQLPAVNPFDHLLHVVEVQRSISKVAVATKGYLINNLMLSLHRENDMYMSVCCT